MENESRSKYNHEYPVNLKQTSPYNGEITSSVIGFFIVGLISS